MFLCSFNFFKPVKFATFITHQFSHCFLDVDEVTIDVPSPSASVDSEPPPSIPPSQLSPVRQREPSPTFSDGKYLPYTRKNAQVATDLQTSCNKSVHKLLTRCIRTACSEFVGTSLEQAVEKL